ncbi:MAG: hypothetical protein NUV65_02960 [Candidatus Roizmanbacteria bacterium]|nr:hypothetical protein [Candidatus Roizmanbacteria bacterium]
MPNEGVTTESNQSTVVPSVEIIDAQTFPAIGGNTPLTDGGMPARTVLEALAEDNSPQPDASVVQQVSNENASKDAIELLQPQEYPLLAQGVKARTLQVLTQLINSPTTLGDPTAHEKLQNAIDAVRAQDATHVGNKHTLSTFIDSLSAVSDEVHTKNAIGIITASAKALTTGDQTDQAVAQACSHLQLISPYSIATGTIIRNVEGTFAQRAQEAIQETAQIMRNQNRVLSPDQERALAEQVMAPFQAIIGNKHILAPDDLTDLMKLAEDARVTTPKAATKIQNNEQLQSLRAGIEQTLTQYGNYLNGTETNWDNSVPDVIADSVAQVLNTEDEIQQTVQAQVETAKRRKTKLKTASLLVALLLGMLVYSSIPKGEHA